MSFNENPAEALVTAHSKLREWADENRFIVLKIDPHACRILVDKVPSQWLAPQWYPAPENLIAQELEDLAVCY